MGWISFICYSFSSCCYPALWLGCHYLQSCGVQNLLFTPLVRDRSLFVVYTCACIIPIKNMCMFYPQKKHMCSLTYLMFHFILFFPMVVHIWNINTLNTCHKLEFNYLSQLTILVRVLFVKHFLSVFILLLRVRIQRNPGLAVLIPPQLVAVEEVQTVLLDVAVQINSPLLVCVFGNNVCFAWLEVTI